MAYRLGVDVGGTFTDFALIDEETGQLWIGKELTTPADPTQAILAGIRAILQAPSPTSELAARDPRLESLDPGLGTRDQRLETRDWRLATRSVGEIVHGTTLATNVVLERKGQPVGLLTTRGFRDVLELGRQKRYELYDMYQTKPVPLVPRHRIREIDERLAFDGSVVDPLRDESVRAAITSLLEEGVQALAITFFIATVNPPLYRPPPEIHGRRPPNLPATPPSESGPIPRGTRRPRRPL